MFGFYILILKYFAFIVKTFAFWKTYIFVKCHAHTDDYSQILNPSPFVLRVTTIRNRSCAFSPWDLSFLWTQRPPWILYSMACVLIAEEVKYSLPQETAQSSSHPQWSRHKTWDLCPWLHKPKTHYFFTFNRSLCIDWLTLPPIKTCNLSCFLCICFTTNVEASPTWQASLRWKASRITECRGWLHLDATAKLFCFCPCLHHQSGSSVPIAQRHILCPEREKVRLKTREQTCPRH